MPVKDKLTVAAIEAAKPREKPFKLFDGGGLYLLIRPDGARWWRLKYRYYGTEKLLSLGTYPTRSLKAARVARDAARQQLADGVDPSAKRQADKAARRSASENTFQAVALEWFGKRSRTWAPNHAEKILGRLKAQLFREIGTYPIATLTGEKLFRVLQSIEQKSTGETAKRCRQYMDAIFRYAIQTHRTAVNPTPHHETLAPVKGGKFASITEPKAIGALVRAMRGYRGSSSVAAALRLAPILFVRPGELRGATWDEMDLDAAEWRIPAERMKMRRPHLVPLSSQALAILRPLFAVTGAERAAGVPRYVFPGERTVVRPISENTLNAALRSLGYTKAQMTAHGFRHMASTLLHESGKFPSEVIERQLAHADRNKIRAVYNAAEYLAERRTMMQWWADRLDALAAEANAAGDRTSG